MIDLYASPTPNVLKVRIMLEEVGLPYRLLPINVWKGDQFTDAFKALNPNSKVPVIVDADAEGGPCPVFESAAILIYLAEKTGRFLPTACCSRRPTRGRPAGSSCISSAMPGRGTTIR